MRPYQDSSKTVRSVALLLFGSCATPPPKRASPAEALRPALQRWAAARTNLPDLLVFIGGQDLRPPLEP
jgi:hypothetical protein